ncbi:heme-binding protein [Telluria mixta]|uniref:Heme-binding protein n=1 Tax=Telluria mixta TaxID=34071 RepID=A0ABT2C2U9_9BURK|nr:heme-binding protein [Telluria mixta]MCS0631156.1 heme-binding protein [Telluria mixta]WEM95694.1 heme-binding protein [Telluria mixta]
MTYRTLLFAAVLYAATAAGPARAQVSPSIDPNQITQAEALAIAQAAIRACKAQGMSVNVQVADADGHLRVALASENATLAGLTTAPQKLAAVLAFHTSTRALQARVASDPGFAAQYGKDPRYHFSPGGLPIYKAGNFVAVIAVGGGRNVDESCAIDALKLLPWAKTGN